MPETVDGSTARKHRRIGYRVQLGRPFRHDDDIDVIDGLYRDGEGDPVGRLIPVDAPHLRPDAFLVVPEEGIPLVHVEAALEHDHRVTGYEQVFGILYEAGEAPPAGVTANGDRWDAGDIVVYTFETDDDALAAQD